MRLTEVEWLPHLLPPPARPPVASSVCTLTCVCFLHGLPVSLPHPEVSFHGTGLEDGLASTIILLQYLKKLCGRGWARRRGRQMCLQGKRNDSLRSDGDISSTCDALLRKKINSLWQTSLGQAASMCSACFAVRTGGPARAKESTFPLCYIFNKAKHAENHFPPNYRISFHNGPSSRAPVTPLILHIPLHALSETYCILMQVRWLTFSRAGAPLIVRRAVTVEGFECLGFTERSGSVHHMFVVLLLWWGLTMQHEYFPWIYSLR